MREAPFDPARLYSMATAAEVLDLEPSSMPRFAKSAGLTILRLNEKTVRLAGAELARLVERAKTTTAQAPRGRVRARASS